MRIGIDISALAEPGYTGIGVFVKNLVKSLARIDRENEYNLCLRLSRLKYGWMKNPVNQDNFRLKIIQDPFNFLFQRKLDVFHGPGERLPEYSHPKKVVTIYDLAAIKGGDFMTDDFRNMIKERYRGLLAEGKADAIITISESSKNDIVEHYGTDPGKIHVIPGGVEEIFRPRPDDAVEPVLRKFGIERPYILNVSAVQERKNISRVINAFSQYLKSGKNAQLVLSGKPTYGYDRIVKTVKDLELGEKVKFLGHVEQEELASLYSGALFFCFPSLYEGFGLPIVEAFACGCPVITSTVTSMPEVAGDAAILVNPYETSEIFEAMLRLSDDEERASYREKGLRRAGIFNWDENAKKVKELYLGLRNSA